MLQAGVGAPLLKLWVLAALDPAATAKGDLGEGDLGVSGIGRARARLTRAARRHPTLSAILPPPILTTRSEGVGVDPNDSARSVADPGDASCAPPLAVRAGWVRDALRASSACGDPRAATAAVTAVNNAVFEVDAARRVLLTLVPIRPRSRGERRSLRTFARRFSPPTPRFQSPPSMPFNSN